MSIKIVANGKIEVNNVKPILHFLTVCILTVMPEIPCLELYKSERSQLTEKASLIKKNRLLRCPPYSSVCSLLKQVLLYRVKLKCIIICKYCQP
jgi:hypothetical protein